MCEYLASPSLNSEKVQRLITVRSCGGRRPGPRRTATQPRSRRPRCELPPPPSRRHRSPVGFSASCGGAAPSPVRVRVAAGAPGIGGPDCGRPSAPGREPPCWDLSADPPPSRFHVPGAGEDVWEKKNDTPHLLGTSSNDLSSPSLSLKSYTNWTVSSDNKYNSPLLVLSIFIVSHTVTLNVFRSVLFCFKQK